MKKTIVIFAVILLGLFILLSLLDNGEYAAEKRLWSAQKEFQEIARDPKVVPDRRFDDLAEQYRKIIKSFPKGALTPKIFIKIGNIYMLKKDYAQARANFQQVRDKYQDDENLNAEALLSIGNSYELEGQDNQAVSTYQEIIRQYSTTVIGLNMPIYLANFYLKKNQPTLSAEALLKAESFYQNMIEKHQNTVIELESRRLLAMTYLTNKNWIKAINSLSEIIMKFSAAKQLSLEQSVQVVQMINTIAVGQLHNYDTAIVIYRNFINKNPDHPFNNVLKKVIQGLQELKEKKPEPVDIKK